MIDRNYIQSVESIDGVEKIKELFLYPVGLRVERADERKVT